MNSQSKQLELEQHISSSSIVEALDVMELPDLPLTESIQDMTFVHNWRRSKSHAFTPSRQNDNQDHLEAKAYIDYL